MNILFFHIMSTLIGLKCLSEVLFPCFYADYSASEIVITRSEKGVEEVLAASCCRKCQRSFVMSPIFSEDTEIEMKFLPVTFARLIYSAEDSAYSRYQGKPGKRFKIVGCIQCWRNKQMRNTSYPYSMKRA